jgi:hypothetical protein
MRSISDMKAAMRLAQSGGCQAFEQIEFFYDFSRSQGPNFGGAPKRVPKRS